MRGVSGLDLASMVQVLVLVGFFHNYFFYCAGILHVSCSNSNISDMHLVSQFVMVQHQLRGVLEVFDNCSFRVREFDMLEGVDVHWWGAVGEDFESMMSGFVISDDVLNRTYTNDSMVVYLGNNLTWDQIAVVSVWDKSTASDFGHVVLKNPSNKSDAPSGDASSLPSDSGTSAGMGWTTRGQPTMFENCRELSKSFRLRWTVNEDGNSIDIGLEAATGIKSYMAFGWANPNSSSGVMLHSDVTITGFTEEGMPFSDDFFITGYSECMVNRNGSVRGVCPDVIYEGDDPVNLVNDTKLLYGHRKDGVSFVRYQRQLNSSDDKYDVPINATDTMRVVWALGLVRPPDTLRPYYLPQYHSIASEDSSSFGHFTLNISELVNDCLGPLDAGDRVDQHVITADGNTPLVVTAGASSHYLNPPCPPKVLFINRKEAPLLRVERGVEVKFSIQAGHDVAFYITSDPLGGNATLRGMNETIFAGGSKAEGVPASPTEMIWSPNRNTPDQIYYQSLYGKKMGWKMEVVDGGLADMYNNSVLLDDQQVTLHWRLSEKTISFAVRGERKSRYLAIGFGRGMVDAFAYVGWIDDRGYGHVSTYWIDARNAYDVHPTHENLTYVRCDSDDDVITFEFTRPLIPKCNRGEQRRVCENIIDPTTPLRVVWAMGAKWSGDDLNEKNMHFATSNRPIRVLLMRGSAEAEQDMLPVLTVHGFMMFVAWGILFPGGVLVARYLKNVKGDQWFQSHIYLQYSGLAIVLLGIVFAIAELRGFYLGSLHVKLGLTATVLACSQPMNACFRPKGPAQGQARSSQRVVWECLHVVMGRITIISGIAALFSGLKHLGDRYGGENVHGLAWALGVWLSIGMLVVLFLECRSRSTHGQKRSSSGNINSGWVFDPGEEDDSADLLGSVSGLSDRGSSRTMEIQLEPLNR